jgi:outer membrane protein insertion porin family
VFDRKRVEVSVNRLKNLGYFSDVQDVAEPLEEKDQYDLAFQVEEKSTGQFMVGGGISSIDSVVGFVEVSQGNFDLKSWPPIGGGQKARVRAQLGSERQDAEISFVEPWFMDRRLSLGLDLFCRESSYYTADYDQTLAGFRVSLARPLTKFDRVSLIYSLENYDIDVDDSASPELQREDGALLRSGLQLEWSRDTRDNYFIPRRGNRTVASATFTGGPLLGDVDIYGMELRSSYYWPLLWDHVFNIRGSVQTVDVYSGSRVPIFDRLFLGGARTVRAFEYQEVGPVDSRDDPIGGRTLYYTTLEYTVPIWNRIRGATFYDMGFVNSKAYDFSASGLNSGVGFGIRFDMPGFPLNLDYAWPIQSEDYNDRGGRFSFQIGYMF